MKRLSLYLAGPMTGLPDYNYPAFFAMATVLRQAGYVVLNPAEVGVHPTWTWADYMRVGLATLTDQAEAVAVLPGWEQSRGVFSSPGGLGAMGRVGGLYIGTAVSPIGGICSRNLSCWRIMSLHVRSWCSNPQ